MLRQSASSRPAGISTRPTTCPTRTQGPPAAPSLPDFCPALLLLASVLATLFPEQAS
ncbi:hypothetical protein CGCTS75_v014513 [Colletotrichum tropicale]|uniref:uncharacterized protein n=1 Tax=Colletotrichum aenigma TaxID=1215731 RepID=UPI0018726CD4|nr:uncharacterized protein CGCA056_v010742 [Colletotrichum aenigma]KAF4810665.1 hypothetical protein CGCTS75_v014513 [Colletotrichum tropicale]KAF4896144.1 hypothetical protein CGCFRS4_v005583 [Colletotrichum fructicola]KAF4922442.1 hypothetical protein CGCF245_v015323 [Colletotrichum fructicola]KAF5518223.1 hypothetical protein CGCA056_v010742 [Colletotrichum aenigma]